MKIRIVHLALAVIDRGEPGEIADAINEALRPARLDARNSLILDYAFNSDGNCPRLPPPVAYDEVEEGEYAEGSFLRKVGPSIQGTNI